MNETVEFTFDGITLTARKDVSVAAALTGAGHRQFRLTNGNKPRGIFCGIGVCQDCLLTIDGRPNRRACMTPVEDGMRVETQIAQAPLVAQNAAQKTAERRAPDVLIVGGGAAGLAAGIAARSQGADVLLLDERKVAGGQYFKQRASAHSDPVDRQQAHGANLIDRARARGVEILPGAEVWGAFEGPEIMASTETHTYALKPGALIVATGAYERPIMIPGWTLPGVMTVGAAQTLWRSYGVLPGKRVAIFGNGPLCAQVALELSKGGAEITVLGEAAPPGWTRPGALLSMASNDRLLAAKGVGMLLGLRRRGIFVSWRAQPLAIKEDGDKLIVRYQVGGAEHKASVDAVCLNFGFQPQNEILRLLGARMRFDERFGQVRPERNANLETSVSGVYAVGDCCGLGGAHAALIEGHIAGIAASGGADPTPRDFAALSRHRRFQNALWRLYAADMPEIEHADGETVICRCEEVTCGAVDDALSAGARDIGAIKRATRVGMGRCQGRYCAPALADYLAKKSGRKVEDRSFFAPQVPIKPVDVATVAATEVLLNTPPADG
ncbi:MAG: 2Fe-2S iron-sulfur cluster-binding protein [Pseudomonadota bacterium]